MEDTLFRKMFNHYRPELHYMRGPGPKWLEKHSALGECAMPQVYARTRTPDHINRHRSVRHHIQGKAKGLIGVYISRKLFLVVADTTDLVADLRVESLLL